jgi:hypothetical protein
MKVGRSIVSLVNKRSPPSSLHARAAAVAVNPQLAQLSESIENMTQTLYKGEAKVEDIVSYQADRVFTSSTARSSGSSSGSSASGGSSKGEGKAKVETKTQTVAAVAAAVATPAPALTPPTAPAPVPVTAKTEKPKARSSMLKKLLTRKSPTA